MSNRSDPYAKRRSLISRDAMNSVSRQAVATYCVRIFDRIQQAPRAVQVVSLAAAFALMTDAANVSAPDAYNVALNVMKEKRGPDGMEPQFRAMKYHLETELLGTRPE